MDTKTAASTLGSTKSEAKATAARINGKRGGRPGVPLDCTEEIRQEALRRLDYSPDTGLFIWRSGRGYAARGRKVIIGAQAGTNMNGYLTIRLSAGPVVAHRLAWLIVNGPFTGKVDHKDGNKSNNAISNLRLCNTAENAHNAKTSAANKSGVKGVFWDKKASKWRAQIMANGKHLSLGLFTTIADAAEARRKAAESHHKEFVNHGTPQVTSNESA